MLKIRKKPTSRLHGILVPYISGKTELCNTLNNYRHVSNIEHIILYVDEFVEKNMKDLHQNVFDENFKKVKVFPVIKDEVYKTLAVYPRSQVIIITANYDLLCYLGLKLKRIFTALLSRKLFNTLRKEIKEENVLDLVDQSREDFIAEFGKKTKIFETFTELEYFVTQHFDLVRKL